jgi:hypothetical protein
MIMVFPSVPETGSSGRLYKRKRMNNICDNFVLMSGARVFAPICLIALLFTAGCTSGVPCITGDGKVVAEERFLEPYSSIDLRVPADVYISQGDPHPVRIEGEENIIRIMTTRVKNGELQIEFDRSCVRPGRPVIILLEIRDLKKITVSGTGSVTSIGVIHADRLEADIPGSGSTNLTVDTGRLTTNISGSGTAIFSGFAATHMARISGSGNLSAGNLSTRSTAVEISGTGQATVDAEEILNTKVSGSGTILYHGSPPYISQDIARTGHISQI